MVRISALTRLSAATMLLIFVLLLSSHSAVASPIPAEGMVDKWTEKFLKWVYRKTPKRPEKETIKLRAWKAELAFLEKIRFFK